MPSDPLINSETQKYYQKEPKCDGVYLRNKLRKIKDGAYVTNLDDFKSMGTYWIALYANVNNTVYFDHIAVEHIPKQI